MNPHDEIKKADEAERLLKNPILREAWASYEAILLNLLANADTSAEKAVEIRGWLIAARKSRGHIERIVKDGAIAAEQIRLEASRKKSFAARMFRAA